MTRNYHSCFIVDVKVDDDKITLTDSVRCKYYIDTSDQTASKTFVEWFKKSFMKGLPQSVTVFKYEDVESEEGIAEHYIKKIFNVDVQQV